jgi:type IV pilus assembly protein PilC
MKRFNYRAKDRTGRETKGKVDAASANDAARLLREKGLVVIKIQPEREFFLVSLYHAASNRITVNDVAILTRQFATMVNAGLPITDSLVIIRSQSKPNIKPIVSQILADVEGGSSLAASMEKHPKLFDQVYTSLIKAGETGGVLDKILLRLAENIEKQREFQAKVKGALIYPAIVVVGMMIVMTIMMVFVVPKLTSIYKDFGATLPTPTKILIGISEFSQHYWWLLPIVLIGGSYLFKAYRNTESGRKKVDSLKLRLPITGPMNRTIILTEFSRTLGLLVGAGIPILEGLRVVARAVGNEVVEAAITRAEEKVEKGFSLAYALSQESKVFPPMLYQMMAVGEETGKVDETLLSISRVFEQESEHAVKNLTTAIEPAIMVFLGVAVGALVIAIILPIYSLTSQF